MAKDKVPAPEVFTITGAQRPLSQEQTGRTRKYLISMGIRTACVLAAIVVPGWPRWVLIAGAVSVIGTWHQFEKVDDAARVGLPVQMVGAVDPEVLPEPGDFTGYLRVSASTPPSPGLTVISRPQIDDSMNLSYAGQWLLFAGVALVGWFFFLRREAKEAPV